MDRIINPYNALAFYTEVLEEHEETPLFSPHKNLPAWQIEFNTTEVSGGVTATIVDDDLGTVQSIAGAQIGSTATSDGKTYITYTGNSNLSSSLNEGMYRIKLVTADDTYYSHPICVSNAFQEMEFQLLAVCASASGGGFVYSPISNLDTGMEKNYEVDYGTGFTWIGTTSGNIDSANIIGSGDVTLPIRHNQFYPDGSVFYKEYTLSINTVSGCSSASLSFSDSGGRHYDNYCYLEFDNTNDLSGMGLLYQGSYKQRVYFHAAYDFPVPVTEETFLANGQNDPFLETAAIGEQLNIDVYPIPDYLITVLQAVRYHDTVVLVTCADEKRVTLTNFQFTPVRVDDDIRMKGRITAEINRVFIKGCQTDKTPA